MDDDDLTIAGDEQWLADLREQRLAQESGSAGSAPEALSDDVTVAGDEQWLADLREERARQKSEQSGPPVGAAPAPVATHADSDANDEVTIAAHDDPADAVTILRVEMESSDPPVPNVQPVKPVGLSPPPPVSEPPTVPALDQQRRVVPPPTGDTGGTGWQPPTRLQAGTVHESVSAAPIPYENQARSRPSAKVLAAAAVALLVALVIAGLALRGSDGSDDSDVEPGVQTTLPEEVTE